MQLRHVCHKYTRLCDMPRVFNLRHHLRHVCQEMYQYLRHVSRVSRLPEVAEDEDGEDEGEKREGEASHLHYTAARRDPLEHLLKRRGKVKSETVTRVRP